MSETTNLSALCVRLRDDAVKRVSGGFGHDAEQLAEWAKHTLEWEAADRIEELEGIVRELLHRIDGSMVFITSRQKINPEYGPGWIAEATDRARAAMGE